MKKLISFVLLLGLAISLCACAGEEKIEITMQEVYDASISNNMLKNHDSVLIELNMDGKPYEVDYIDEEYTFIAYQAEYYSFGTDYEFFTSKDAYYSFVEGDYTRTFVVTKEGLIDNYIGNETAIYILGQETANETIQSITKEGDYIKVLTQMDEATIAAMGIEELAAFEGEYVLDAKTRELVSTDSKTTYTDDFSYNFSSKISYDVEVPEAVKVYIDFENQTENLRTITLVLHPGTENELTLTVQAPKGVLVQVEPDDYYNEMVQLFTDAECTTFYDPLEDTESDTTIYVRWYE